MNDNTTKRKRHERPQQVSRQLYLCNALSNERHRISVKKLVENWFECLILQV